MHIMRSVTLKQIAEAAGVHFGTVSKALQGDASISVATRDRIQRLANEMGYRKDPLLSALCAYRKNQRRGDQTVLGYITNWPRGHEPKLRWGQGEYLPAAIARASELGYRIEEFSLSTPKMNPRRLSEILVARGVPGVIVQDSPYTTALHFQDFDWNAFSCCAIGYSLQSPSLARVAHSPYLSMVMAMRGLMLRGYRRIALWLNDWQDERVGHQWSDAYFGECRRAGIEPLSSIFKEETTSVDLLHSLLKKTRPEVLISYGAVPGIRDIRTKYSFSGKPLDWFVLNIRSSTDPRAHANCSGIDQNLEVVGRTAVDVVLAHMMRRERGPINEHIITLVTGDWHQGETTVPSL